MKQRKREPGAFDGIDAARAKQDLQFAERLDLAYLSRRIATNARRPGLIANSRRDLDPYETHPQFS